MGATSGPYASPGPTSGPYAGELPPPHEEMTMGSSALPDEQYAADTAEVTA